MPHTKQASGDTFAKSPTQTMTTGPLARSGIAVGKGSRPLCLVAS
jgi:hypothetical protein